MSQIDRQICDAIDSIANERLRTAGFNKTIIGIIDSVLDFEEGVYLVQYQGEKFKCYDLFPDRVLDVNKSVYILILNNDMSNDKFILSETKGG